MTGAAWWAAAGCLVAAAFVALPRRGPARLRTALAAVAGGPAGRRIRPARADAVGRGEAVAVARPDRPSTDRAGARRRDPRRAVAGLAGVAAALVIGGWTGLVVGVVAAVACDRALRRLEPAAVRAERLRCAADLPVAADLVAAALRAGAPVDRAVAAVAGAVGGPLGERLGRVGRSLRLGAEPVEAWEHVADLAHADRLTAAAVRSASSGAALAGALGRLADDLRAERAVAAEAAARRAGVLMVLPLGLCFLPAFILAGLVPVIVAVLGDVL